MANERIVYFAHGHESGPWGTKIKRLAQVAENLNFIYGHIHAATEKFITNDKNDLMTSAYFASSEILDGWKGLVEKTA